MNHFLTTWKQTFQVDDGVIGFCNNNSDW